ncbi:MAG: S8 family serine peptidase, partial [Candidatus Omnitrophica bacterium]|nr:S8 family serine peptidase [Candidatus Omnitrophota bacterium]
MVVLGLSIIFIFGMNARVQATNISYKEFPTVFQYQLPETIVINAFPVIAVAVDPLQEDALAAIRSETKTVAAIEVVSSGEEVQEVVTQPVEAKAAKTNFTARNTEVVSKKEDTTAQTQKQAEPKTELASINVAVPKPLPDYTEKKTVLAEEENSPKAVPAKAVSFRYPKEKSEVYVETTPVKVDEEPKEVKNEPPPKPEPEIKIPEVVTPAPVQPVQEEPLPENDKSEAPKELASIPAPVVVAPEKEFKVLNSAILDTSSSSLTKRFGSAPIGGFIQKPKVVLSETGFKKGEIIVKFKSTGPYTVDTCAECLIKHKQSFKNYVRDNSNSLDQINQLAGVKDARSFFDRHGLNAEEALYKQRLINQKALEHFQIRTNKFQAASQKPLADMSSIYVLKVPEDSNIQQLVALYQNDPHVEFAQPNYIFKKTAFPSDPPNDTYYASDLWGLNNIGQNVGQVGTADSDIDAPEAWAQNTLGAGIVVAVNDSGVDVTHEDLSSQIWVNPGETAGNGVDDDLNGYIDDINGWDFTEDDNNPSDGDGHGTHVAGTIAAIGNNSQGVIGVAPSAEIMVVKGLDDDGFGTSESLANGIVYAAQNGADVINNSWGCTPSFACASDFIIETAVRNAHDLGVVLVFAAGNDDADVALASPQNMDEPIVVAATDNRDGIASFSNYGNTVDISAPGVFVLSTYPGDNYAYSSGTSMSSPHVAGAAAVLLTHPKYN